jgi:RNA polymerase sigma-70 factor, ECF subfamily
MLVSTTRGEDFRAAHMAKAYKHHARFVKRTLRRLGVTHADADDVLQLVFLVIHRRFDEYVEVSAKRAWLFTVSTLLSKNYHRAIRRARARRRRLVPPPIPDPEVLLFRREAARRVARFLDELDEPVRRAFYLANFEGLTAREIALALDMNMNTVYSRIRTARQLFDSRLAGTG